MSLSQQQHHKIAMALVAVSVVMVAWTGAGPKHVGDVVSGTWEPGTVWVHANLESTEPFHSSLGASTGASIEMDGVAMLNPWRYQAFDCGPADLLLDHDPGPGWFTMDLQFYEFLYDGQPAVASEQLPCPFPSLHMAMAEVLDAVSYVMAMELILVDTSPAGTVYEIFAAADAKYLPEDMEAALVERDRPASRLDTVEAYVYSARDDFVHYSDLEFDDLGNSDRVPLLDLFEWSDADGDGFVSHGDHLSIVYDLPEGRDVETHAIMVAGNGTGAAIKAIMVTRDGVLDWNLDRSRAPRLITEGDEARVEANEWSQDVPLDRVQLYFSGSVQAQAKLSEPLPEGFRYVDADGNGMLSDGDSFTAGPQRPVTIGFTDTRENIRFADLHWD